MEFGTVPVGQCKLHLPSKLQISRSNDRSRQSSPRAMLWKSSAIPCSYGEAPLTCFSVLTRRTCRTPPRTLYHVFAAVLCHKFRAPGHMRLKCVKAVSDPDDDMFDDDVVGRSPVATREILVTQRPCRTSQLHAPPPPHLHALSIPIDAPKMLQFRQPCYLKPQASSQM